MTTAWPFNPAWNDHEAEIFWQVRNITPDTPTPDKLMALTPLAPILAKMGHLETEAVLTDFAARLNIPAKFLSALRKDAQKARKGRGQSQGKGDKEAVYTAILPGLVDLVEHEGAPSF